MRLIMVVFLLSALTFATPASAYIDPGSGSLVLQMLIAAGLGALFKIRALIAMVKGWFRKPR